jgi:transposase
LQIYLERDSIGCMGWFLPYHPLDGFCEGLFPFGELIFLRCETVRLKARVQTLENQLAEQLAEKDAVINALNARLTQTSATSNQPPSSDAFKPRTLSQRQKSGKPSGGQPGHEGRTRLRTETPTHTVDHRAHVCSSCQTPLTETPATRIITRQVIDLPPPPPPETTEHRVHVCTCPNCGTINKSTFPKGINAPVQYGPRVEAIVASMHSEQMLPVKRTQEFLEQHHGLTMSQGTVVDIATRVAKRCEPITKAILTKISQAPSKNSDETGARVAGESRYYHVIATPFGVHIKYEASRGAVYGAGCGSSGTLTLTGVLVHDNWKPHWNVEGVTHALCGEHLLRTGLGILDALERNRNAGRAVCVVDEKVAPLREFLQRACHRVNEARKAGLTALPAAEIEALEAEYDRLVEETLQAYEALPPLSRKETSHGRGPQPKRPGHNWVQVLKDRRDAVLLFLHDFNVPFTNNLAEQAIRMPKVKLKVAGGFRSVEGAKTFATLRSVVATAQKNDWNPTKIFQENPEKWIKIINSS